MESYEKYLRRFTEWDDSSSFNLPSQATHYKIPKQDFENILWELKSQLKEANETIAFYGDISNLDKPAYQRQGVLVRNLKQAAYVDGGKRARDYQDKYKEKLNG